MRLLFRFPKRGYGMEQKKTYFVVRSLLDHSNMLKDQKDISGHDAYHEACESLRKNVADELKKLFRIGPKDIFDRNGNFRQDCPYLKDWFTEYDPYRWRIRDPSGKKTKQMTIVYEVKRRSY